MREMREMPEMCEIWYEHAGTRLFAVESGTGRPWLVFHGALATHAATRLYAGEIPGRLITPDLRASGRSHYAGELSWDLLADDAAALARHLGITRAVIGGFSFGAGVAVAVALRHPQLVAALALVHPAYGGAELGLTSAQRDAMDAMDAAGRRAPTEGIEVMYPLLPPHLAERGRALFATYDPASVAATTRFAASGAQPFQRATDLVAISAPTLVVPGIEPQHPPEVADVYARHVPRCRIGASLADAELA
jgi:pimeloyl-ACP methyl ester carboxylesterase